MYVIRYSILFLIFSLFINFNVSYGSEQLNPNDPDRNWRHSLNVSFNQHTGHINVDDWVKSTTAYLTEEYKTGHIQPLIEYNIASNNIATTQLKFLYLSTADDKLHIDTFSSSLNKLFLSGLRRFKEETPQEVQQKIILSHRFCPPNADLKGQQINAHLKNLVNTLIGNTIVTEASHSEALILLQLNDELPNLLDLLITHHGHNNTITILGTILVISSLKDPCEASCIPMLKQFNQYFPTILSTRARECRYSSQIRFANNLERLILLAGRVEFLGSRNAIRGHLVNFNEDIAIDFEQPQARIFSLQFQDLKI